MGEGGPRERLEVMVYNMPLKKMVMMKNIDKHILFAMVDICI